MNTGNWVLVDVRPPPQHKAGAPEGAVSVPMYQPLDWSKPDVGKVRWGEWGQLFGGARRWCSRRDCWWPWWRRAAQVIKFVAYSFNGVTPVEPNPNFLDDVKKVRGRACACGWGSGHAGRAGGCATLPLDGGAQWRTQLASSGKGIITLCEAGGTLKPSTNFPFGKASRSLQAAYRLFAEGITEQVRAARDTACATRWCRVCGDILFSLHLLSNACRAGASPGPRRVRLVAGGPANVR